MPSKPRSNSCATSARSGKEDLVDRSAMAREIDDKGAPYGWGDAFVLEELHHVIQVARMLPAHCGDQLSNLDILEGGDGNLQVSQQPIASSRHERSDPRRMDGSAHHEIDLDLDLGLAPADHQLGLQRVGRRVQSRREAARLKARLRCRNALPMRMRARARAIR